MREAQRAGVQQQAGRQGLHVGRRVQGVAEDGVPQFGEVDAQLVRAAGDRLQFDAGGPSGFAVPQHAPAGEARLAVLAIDDPQGPVGPVDEDRQVDRSPDVRRRCGPPGDDCDVALADLARGEGLGKRTLRRRAARHHHQPGSCHVEPVHDQRIGVAGLHPSAQAILLVGAAPRHRQEAAGLVDHQQGVVNVEWFHVGCDGRGHGRSGGFRRIIAANARAPPNTWHRRKRIAGAGPATDDSHMRRAALKPATPIWTSLLVVLALCLGACASRPASVEKGDAEALLELQPDGAFYRDGTLVLQYSVGTDKVFLTASWPVDDLDPDRHNYRTAVMDLTPDAPATPAALQRDWQPVTLLAHARWEALVSALLERLAPADAATGTLVTIQGSDFVLHRERDGRLRSTRLENKPAALRVGRRVSEEAFAELANDYLKAELTRAGAAAGPVLFPAGEDELGGAFVLFDFARRQSVFIAQPPSPLPPGRQLGFSLRLIDALTLRSHVFSALQHPVTMTNRLFWLTTHSGAVLLPRGVAAPNGAPPPLATGEGMDLHAWETRLDELVGADHYRGSMQPLIDGDAFFVSLVQAIQEARESVDVRLYIFDSDDYALRIADLLKARSREIRGAGAGRPPRHHGGRPGAL